MVETVELLLIFVLMYSVACVVGEWLDYRDEKKRKTLRNRRLTSGYDGFPSI